MKFLRLYRLKFHINIALQNFQVKAGLYKDKAGVKEYFQQHPEEEKEISKRVEQLFRDDGQEQPVLIPRETMCFRDNGHVLGCNFLNARFLRKEIVRTVRWASEHGFTTFLIDYAAPFGVLALETLNILRDDGAEFKLYTYKGNYRPRRKSYRLIPETEIELLAEVLKADYNYHVYRDEALKLGTKACILCHEHGLYMSQIYPAPDLEIFQKSEKYVKYKHLDSYPV